MGRAKSSKKKANKYFRKELCVYSRLHIYIVTAVADFIIEQVDIFITRTVNKTVNDIIYIFQIET